MIKKQVQYFKWGCCWQRVILFDCSLLYDSIAAAHFQLQDKLHSLRLYLKEPKVEVIQVRPLAGLRYAWSPENPPFPFLLVFDPLNTGASKSQILFYTP